MNDAKAKIRSDVEYVLDILRELERSPNVSRHKLADRLATGEVRLNRYLKRLIDITPVGLVTEGASGLRCTEVKGPVVREVALQIVQERYAAKMRASKWRKERTHSSRLRTRAGRSAYSDFRRYYAMTRDKKIRQIKVTKARRLTKLRSNDAKTPEVWIRNRTRELLSNGRREVEAAKKKCREQKGWAKARVADVEAFERLFSLIMATASDKRAKRGRQRLLRECMELWWRIEESSVLTRWTEVRRYLEARDARRRYYAFKRAEFQKQVRVVKGLLNRPQGRPLPTSVSRA